MDSNITALIIAVVGIIGTLSSALLTQRSANNSKIRELERADEQRREERLYQAQSAAIEARRTCCAALNTAARLYQTELTNYLHALNAGDLAAELGERVEEARLEHRARHSEAQMILPDPVLTSAGAVNGHLGRLYGVLKRLDFGNPEPGETLAVAEAMRAASWDLLAEMRAVMRRDLGVAP
ncbi:hypothetical protein [Streptomyces sp. NPDC056821]|uniref:hypothetical protein n=1 Tax=unclassified Streptomyces TaxID=2593676 RepID=UPI003692DCC9